jgi:hypothetical protein
LLRDVVDIRIAPKHAAHCADDEHLVPLNQFFEGGRVASANQTHQANVFVVLLEFARW